MFEIIKTIFSFLNDILLKMTWLEDLSIWILRDVINLEADTLLFNSLSFFIYDVIKILILLSVLIFISSYIQSYFTPEKTRASLSKYKGIKANIIAALMGTVTPFCSCSSIPIFIGFTKAGLPIGVTFSFLISSPLVDLASVLLLASIFNWTVALMYVVAGLILAVVGGTLISAFKMEKYLASFLQKQQQNNQKYIVQEDMKTKDRLLYSKDQVKDVITKVYKYIIIGVLIGAIIHGFIPQTWIENTLGQNNVFNVLIATLLGIPMYADIFGTLPIASALVLKGVGIGTVLAFMMAVTALSVPSLIMLKKVVEKQLLFVFVGIVTIGIILIGYIFNALDFWMI
jgi:uncharacterized membrane protein YraQ (UPF0718 family)